MGGQIDVRVGLCDDVASFRRDHDACTEGTGGGVIDGLKETSRDTSSTFDSWPVVELTVVVGWAVLDPVAYRITP